METYGFFAKSVRSHFGGANRKECLAEVDRGERLRQTHEGRFHWSRHKRGCSAKANASLDLGFFANNKYVLVLLIV